MFIMFVVESFIKTPIHKESKTVKDNWNIFLALVEKWGCKVINCRVKNRMAIFFCLQETIIGTWTTERVGAGAVWKDTWIQKKILARRLLEHHADKHIKLSQIQKFQSVDLIYA